LTILFNCLVVALDFTNITIGVWFLIDF
jgi:hypothetical protein